MYIIVDTRTAIENEENQNKTYAPVSKFIHSPHQNLMGQVRTNHPNRLTKHVISSVIL